MKIMFHDNFLNLRGTSVAIYDYAFFNETLLGNESVILTKRNLEESQEVIEKFQSKFKVIFYEKLDEIDKNVLNEKVDIFYAIKDGNKSDIVSKECKTVIHSVFFNEPHGDIFAFISEWLSQKYTNGACPFVPHMINLPSVKGDLREQLSIPKEAIVFGRHGGRDSFDINFVKEAIKKILKKRTDVYFIFINTNPFYNHPRIKYIKCITDMEKKVKFINSCDAMIHARIIGESFGIAIGEFSSLNKPIITYSNSLDMNHQLILGNKAFYYSNLDECFQILNTFEKNDGSQDWNMYSDFTPLKVMDKFNQIFIRS